MLVTSTPSSSTTTSTAQVSGSTGTANATKQDDTSGAAASSPSAVVSISAMAYALSVSSTSASGATTQSRTTAISASTRVTPSRATAPDVRPPSLLSFSPTRGAVNVNPNAKLSFTFNEAIRKGTGNIVIKDANDQVVETFDIATSTKVAISGGRLTVDPTDALLNPLSRYTVSIDAGAVTDLAGNQAAADSTYNFTTMADKTAPKITSFSPTANAKDVALDANISYSFSEAVRFGSGTIQLKNADGDVVESFDVATSQNIALSADGKTLTIDPTKKLASNVGYSVVLAKGSVQDQYGNNFAGATSKFTTERSGFNIDIAYSGPAAYKKYFNQAKAILESAITTDLPDVNGVDDLKITASVANIDGVGRILGQASPTVLRQDSHLPVAGNMKFDTADVANMARNGTLGRVILHEMAHVLGVGALWSTFGLNATFGQYSGANALRAYREISGDNSKAYVPLETGGGAGTANAHWSEATFQSELMTGYATGTMEMSKLTIGALEDLGYQVDYTQAENYNLPLA